MTARVLSFGYNANFASARRDIFNIADFAKDLLFDMKFGVDENAKELQVGKVRLYVTIGFCEALCGEEKCPFEMKISYIIPSVGQ